MNLQAGVIVDESHFPESIHGKTDPGAGGSDDLGQRLLVDLWNDGLGLTGLSEIRQQQQDAGQPLLAGIDVYKRQAMAWLTRVNRQSLSLK